jgi:GT2 family glycosyltransferase
MKILVSIITHNRIKLLSRCLDGIQSQSRMPDKILVIDNGSTDKTKDTLQKRGIQHISQENVGSAGGWHKAISIALEEEFDAIWLMDDDGFPHKNALKNLELKLTNGVACASSVVMKENDRDSFVFDMPKLNKHKMPALIGIPRKYKKIQDLEPHATEGVYEHAQLFNGALISMQVVKIIGNINRNYFIYGDEVDFLNRMKKGGRVLSVLNAKHFHPDVTSRPYNKIKIYYYLKNNLILYRKYYPQPLFYQIGGIFLIMHRVLKRNGIKTVFSLLIGAWAPAFYSAIFRGFAGKIAKDYDF